MTTGEVGNAALFLLSELGSAVTGECLHVDAGYHIVGMKAEDAPGHHGGEAGRGMRLRDLTLYVIRHGECQANVEGRNGGQNDTPLTERGRRQAAENGRLLKEIAATRSTASPSSPARSTAPA